MQLTNMARLCLLFCNLFIICSSVVLNAEHRVGSVLETRYDGTSLVDIEYGEVTYELPAGSYVDFTVAGYNSGEALNFATLSVRGCPAGTFTLGSCGVMSNCLTSYEGEMAVFAGVTTIYRLPIDASGVGPFTVILKGVDGELDELGISVVAEYEQGVGCVPNEYYATYPIQSGLGLYYVRNPMFSFCPSVCPNVTYIDIAIRSPIDSSVSYIIERDIRAAPAGPYIPYCIAK